MTFPANFGGPVGSVAPERSTHALFAGGIGALGPLPRRRSKV